MADHAGLCEDLGVGNVDRAGNMTALDPRPRLWDLSLEARSRARIDDDGAEVPRLVGLHNLEHLLGRDEPAGLLLNGKALLGSGLRGAGLGRV
eukprot:CAMPEP_0202056338 /NCGR_PEP_ID=MMETSP0963-20130614/23543_1 /ASSEMBLY_ACC=CAM_ASM_000494 /TAXON_ID=4773 /ORGANISM="Schizochytrium aggregatum, Strain ATCC28209" /LENGTH=92 /DNA_ID=CAMNT_0048622059 /DNA_START=289 /DNA_END=567 /DNA_ORIENTATION=+